MATQKINRNMLNTGIVDNSNATAITIDSSENVTFAGAITTPTLITGAYGASGSAGDGFRLNSTDLYGQVDASDKVRIAVAGNSFFNGGNVGIGTSSPDYKLHLSGTGLQRVEIDSTDNNANGCGVYLKVLNSGSIVSQSTVAIDNTGNLKFFTGTSSESEKMRIDSSGALGLKKIPPAGSHTSWSQLFVGEKGSLISENANSGGFYGTWLTDNMYIAQNTGAFKNITTDESSAYRQEGGVHQWFTHASGSADAAITLAEVMRIDSLGKVGIGTNNPTSTLDVRGVFHVGASASTTPVIGRSLAPTGSQGLFLTAGVVNSESTTTPTRADNSSSGASIYLGGNAADQYGGTVAIQAYGTGADGNLIVFENRSATNTFTERMRIDSEGNVGIGATTPNNMIHTQNNSITATQSTGNSWSTPSSGGTYAVQGAIEASGIRNRHVAKWAFSGALSANNWYPFTKRSQLQALTNDTGSSSEEGFGMYFRIYSYTSSSGYGEYFSNRVTSTIWVTNNGSNSSTAQELYVGPGFGHAPNGGHDPDSATSCPFRMRVAHHHGSDSTWPADITVEIRCAGALSGLNSTVAGRQLMIYGYII